MIKARIITENNSTSITSGKLMGLFECFESSHLFTFAMAFLSVVDWPLLRYFICRIELDLLRCQSDFRRGFGHRLGPCVGIIFDSISQLGCSLLPSVFRMEPMNPQPPSVGHINHVEVVAAVSTEFSIERPFGSAVSSPIPGVNFLRGL